MSPDPGNVDGTAPGTEGPDQGPDGAPGQGLFMMKVGRGAVLKALDDRVQPGQQAVIIDDGYGRVDRAAADPRIRRVIDARTEFPTALDGLDGSDVVIYACTQDDIGLPFVEHLHRTGRRYFPVARAEPGGYAFTNTAARTVLEAERTHQRQHGFAKWDFGYRDFENLIQAIEITRALRGCYLEVGCYRGSSAGVVLRYLATQRRTMNACFLDVFDGFSYVEAERSADAFWQGTHATEGLEAIRARLLEYGAGAAGLRITVERCNIITDPLPQAVVEEGIVVANLDVDLHEAVHAGLVKIAPHVVPGGILVVEDPGHTPMLVGARLALEMFLRDRLGEPFIPVVMQSGQTFLIRR